MNHLFVTVCYWPMSSCWVLKSLRKAAEGDGLDHFGLCHWLTIHPWGIGQSMIAICTIRTDVVCHFDVFEMRAGGWLLVGFDSFDGTKRSGRIHLYGAVTGGHVHVRLSGVWLRKYLPPKMYLFFFHSARVKELVRAKH
jgi:hypothetical protein